MRFAAATETRTEIGSPTDAQIPTCGNCVTTETDHYGGGST